MDSGYNINKLLTGLTLLRNGEMIFACYKYKEYHNGNKNQWPLQPPTIQNWCKMVNKDIYYCSDKTFFKQLLFLFFRKFRKLRYSDINSFHWYWREQTLIDLKKSLLTLKSKYYECKKDSNKIKFLFNSSTTLESLEIDIKKLETRINKH